MSVACRLRLADSADFLFSVGGRAVQHFAIEARFFAWSQMAPSLHGRRLPPVWHRGFGQRCARNARSPVCLALLEDLASDELADGLEGSFGRALVSVATWAV